MGLAATAVLVIAAALLVVFFFQRKLLYVPLDRHVPPASEAIPGAEEVTFATRDGLQLHGWFVPAPTRPPAAAILVFNGNAGNRFYRSKLALALRGEGFDVMLFDYRGFADNPGSPSERGLIEDARAARRYLDSRPDVDPTRIAYFGESLGAAVAVGLATERPPAALVLRSPFSSLADVARVHFPYLPVRLLLRDRYPSIERIASVNCPLLVIAGSDDHIVPEAESRALFEAAPGPKRYVEVQGADHNDLALFAGEQLVDETVRFVRMHVPPKEN